MILSRSTQVLVIRYGELDALSSRLAAHLAGLGLGLGSVDVVPLCFEKSMWTAVAVLGVVKTGAAFVLLDGSYPRNDYEPSSGKFDLSSVCLRLPTSVSLRASPASTSLMSLSAPISGTPPTGLRCPAPWAVQNQIPPQESRCAASGQSAAPSIAK